MKRTLIFLSILLFAVSGLFAGNFNDFAIMVGQGNSMWPSRGIGGSLGFSLGLTRTVELDVWLESEIIPEPLGQGVVVAELSLSLLGDRNTGSKVAGSNINTLVSLGFFHTFRDGGMGVMAGLTPIAVGCPSLTRRERCLRTNVGWDWVNGRAVVVFSLLDFEIYLKGTYRDFT